MPECQKIKKGGLDGAEHFDRLIFATIRKSVRLKGLMRNARMLLTGLTKLPTEVVFTEEI